jgi:hypothetical protein
MPTARSSAILALSGTLAELLPCCLAAPMPVSLIRPRQHASFLFFFIGRKKKQC